MISLFVLILIVVLWVVSSRATYKAWTREVFWKYPGIWNPTKDHREALAFSLFGPFALFTYWVTATKFDLPPIPPEAYEMDKQYPDHDDLDRYTAFNKAFKGRVAT